MDFAAESSAETDYPAASQAEAALSETAFPAPSKFCRQAPTPTCTNLKSDDRSKSIQHLAVHRAAVAKTILKSEPANWTQDSGLSDAWMWDLPAFP